MAEPAKIDPTVETTTINLNTDVVVNGIRYSAGSSVRVPKRQAEDILRIDHDHMKYKDSLMSKHTYEVDAGTIAAGGGAQ